MIQEVLTYLIIGAAIYAALSALIRTLLKKERKVKQNTDTHNCTSCPADCMMRDSKKTGFPKSTKCLELP